MRTNSTSGLRALRDAIATLGLAVLLAVGPCALLVPAAATAAPAREETPAAVTEVAQVDPTDKDPGNQDPGQIQGTDPGDEGDDDTGDVETPIPTDQPVGKMYPVEPDSLVKAKAAIPPAAASYDTLKAVAPGSAAARKPGTVPPPPQRRTFLGLTPAVFFAGLLVVHVIVVRAVTE